MSVACVCCAVWYARGWARQLCFLLCNEKNVVSLISPHDSGSLSAETKSLHGKCIKTKEHSTEVVVRTIDAFLRIEPPLAHPPTTLRRHRYAVMRCFCRAFRYLLTRYRYFRRGRENDCETRPRAGKAPPLQRDPRGADGHGQCPVCDCTSIPHCFIIFLGVSGVRVMHHVYIRCAASTLAESVVEQSVSVIA